MKKKILVGITGGIAAYKTCTLVNLLRKEGAEVRVIMTESATKFVGVTTFQSLTGHAVYTDMFNTIDRSKVEHIALADWADVIVVSPATANTISKIAVGIADNLLTTVIMAFPATKNVVLAPAMNTEMWNNPIFQKNLNILVKDNKYKIVEPREGVLACRKKGKGKIASNEEILKVVKENLILKELVVKI